MDCNKSAATPHLLITNNWISSCVTSWGPHDGSRYMKASSDHIMEHCKTPWLWSYFKSLTNVLPASQAVLSFQLVPEVNRTPPFNKCRHSLLPCARPHHSVLAVSSLPFLSALLLRTAPLVGEIAHVMQLEQKALGDIKCGETKPNGNRAFNPVHAQSFVQSFDNSFLGYNHPHGAQDCAVRRAGHASRLHSPAHHVQRIRSGLSNQTRARTKSQTLMRIRMWSLCLFYQDEETKSGEIYGKLYLSSNDNEHTSPCELPVCNFFSVSYVKKVIPAYGMTPKIAGVKPL